MPSETQTSTSTSILEDYDFCHIVADAGYVHFWRGGNYVHSEALIDLGWSVGPCIVVYPPGHFCQPPPPTQWNPYYPRVAIDDFSP